VPGGELRLAGVIDRLDTGPQGAAGVTDYKLGQRRIDWRLVLAGAQVQLFVYLLAVEGQSLNQAGMEALRPLRADYQPLEPRWRDDGSADFEPRGVGAEVTDDEAAANPLLAGALSETRRVLEELASQLTGGAVSPAPLRQAGSGGYNACQNCAYRAVCRFDPAAGDPYRLLPGVKSSELAKRLAAGESFPGSARVELEAACG
jgi:ATP-dependent helicase/DNAse subunit B